MRGLPSGVNPEVINEDLLQQGAKIPEVNVMHTQRGPRKVLPLYLVKSTKEDDTFTSITRVLQANVRWENQRTDIMWQISGFRLHTGRMHRPRQCVKCWKNRTAKDSPKGPKVDGKQDFRCANCKQDHPVSYQGCPSRPNFSMRKTGKPTPKVVTRKSFS